MFYQCNRRRSRQRFIRLLIILIILLIILFFIRSNSKRTAIVKGNISSARLFCILLNTHSTHERFIYISNITWIKRCDITTIVKYRRSENYDNNIPQSKYYVDLWIHILDAIRQSIGTFQSIYENDLLVIVPAPTYVFREKLFSFLNSFTNHFPSPMIIIYEQQDSNAYITNGIALDILRHRDIIDLCLQKIYPSARENYLWKCVEMSIHNEQNYKQCNHNECFIRYQREQLTLSHIKNGFCLEKNLSICQTIALIHPVSINDMINLEFFTYRLQQNF